jgi:hypothetical protein
LIQKPQRLDCILSLQACGRSQVGKSWPLSETRRMHDLSQDFPTFRFFRDLKLARFAQYGVPLETIAKCRKWTPAKPRQTLESRPCNISNAERGLFRIVVPYHRALGTILPAVMNRVSSKLRLMLAPVWPESRNLQIQIAWSNHGKTLSALLGNA